MPLSLTSTQILGKHAISNTYSWLLLIQITIAKRYTLAYSGLSGTIYIGDTITGATSGATATVLDPSASPMVIYNRIGTFSSGETVTSTIGGATFTAGASGTSTVTLRYAQNNQSVTYGGYTWSPISAQLDYVGKYIDGYWREVNLLLGNDETLNNYVDLCEGLHGEQVTLKLVYTENLTEDPAINESWYIVSCSRIGHEWVQFSLGQNIDLEKFFPPKRYVTTPCMHQFKQSTSCRYSGTAVSCNRSLSCCIGLGNERYYGAFPAIPGGMFV